MQSRRRPLRIVQMFLLLAALMFGVTPARAVHNDGVFEVDGDVLFGTGGGGDDWQTLFTCSATGCVASGSGNALVRNWTADAPNASIFTGGGSKDQLDISQWRWTNGNIPPKDDLVSGFAARYQNGGNRLYFGADRFANNGDAQIGTWFLQTTTFLCGGTGPNSVPAGTGGCTAGTFVTSSGALAHQQVGNILVLSNFTGGGTESNIAAYVVTAVALDGAVSLMLIAGGAGVSNLSCDGSDTLCAATNAVNTTALGAYYVPKFGTAGQYPPESLFEGGLNLDTFNLGFECFGSFLHETRSSQSITAVLKDFVLGTFQQCAAGIVTQVIDDASGADLTNNNNVPAGTSLHDEAFVTGTPLAPTPTGTVDFQFFDNLTCTGTPVASESGIALVEDTPPSGGQPGVAKASSSSRTPAPGPHSYHAKYNGDTNYPATGFGACEPFTVTRVASSVDTRILIPGNGEVTNTALDTSSGPVAVVDEATVACGAFTPTGGVTFTFFATADCSGPGTVDNCGQAGGCPVIGGKATSGQHSVTSGVFSFNAVYNGDDNCQPSAASTCEPVCGLPFKQ